jgi:hypothetical protein
MDIGLKQIEENLFKSIRKNLTIRKPMKPFNIPIFIKILFKLFNMSFNYAYKNHKLTILTRFIPFGD